MGDRLKPPPFESIKDKIIWDLNLKKEFINRTPGYGFVIDVCDQVPRLALYRMKPRASDSTIIDQQPPRELLEKALKEQGATNPVDNLYSINNEVREWIEKNVF